MYVPVAPISGWREALEMIMEASEKNIETLADQIPWSSFFTYSPSAFSLSLGFNYDKMNCVMAEDGFDYDNYVVIDLGEEESEEKNDGEDHEALVYDWGDYKCSAVPYLFSGSGVGSSEAFFGLDPSILDGFGNHDGELEGLWLTGALLDIESGNILSICKNDGIEEKKDADIREEDIDWQNRIVSGTRFSFEDLLDSEHVEAGRIVDTFLSDGVSEDSLERMKYVQISDAAMTRGVWKKANASWAVSVCDGMEDFEEYVPNPVCEFPFELDLFQKQAIYHLDQGHSVFVAAHTSAGKTVVAEYAIGMATCTLTKAIYTSPLKALSNQKYREFCERSGKKGQVGLITGDVQVFPDAPLLVMTTEILRSMLYRGSPILADVSTVIFDEVHYLNDQERGVVWEEVLILLAPHIRLVLLSATLPNCMELADWLGRTRLQKIYVVSTYKRPVPLEHYLVVGSKMYKIVDADSNFLFEGYVYTCLNCSYKDARETACPVVKKSETRGTRGGVAGSSRGGMGSSRGRSRSRDVGIFASIISLLRKSHLIPAIIFVFSKRRCEEALKTMSGLDLLSSGERHHVKMFINSRVLPRISEDDRNLPQVLTILGALERGINTHHSGLLPILKEAVEMLFSDGCIKILLATETFAMGVNMPAKAVVFTDKRKPEGSGKFRDLYPGEYTQMAGRAGRRGIDTTGVVLIIPPDPFPMVIL